jgi:type IX secretion system substrate protein
MKLKYILPVVLFLSVGFYYISNKQNVASVRNSPIPTNGNTIIKEGSEDDDNQNKREAWFNLMHSAAPGTHWKNIEYQTSMRRHLDRAEARHNANARGDNEVLADGNLIGQWNERGSINQAGSVFVTEYVPETDEIYLISAGGTLFKGTREGNDWEVINQDLRFENNFLKFIDTGNGQRLLANIIDLPHFSDDGGLTWTPSTGIPFDNSNARSLYPIVLEDGSNHIYMLSKKSYWENFKVYKSVDNGESYEAIINLDNSDQNRYSMVKPHHSNEIYLFEKNGGWSTKFYKINQISNTLELLNQNDDFGLGDDGRSNIAAIQVDTVTRFISYTDNKEVFQSEDFGANWVLNGQMPSQPWSVGIYISPGNPDFMMYGDIECYITSNAGAEWFKVNGWGEYYGDVEGSLHADMMYFNEFETLDGTSFILVSNHGGLNITDSIFTTINNLGTSNLNVSQYYDVATDPIDPIYMYAGSQDQGFQRAVSFDNTEVALFEQVISGDYGHIVFSQNGARMWTVYPGGWVTLYNFPQTSGISASWEVDSDNETVWIPPLMPSPDQSENAIYMAGGNMNGGSGSYLIKLTYNQATTEIDVDQIDYDFYDNSVEGTISMMRTSPVNPDYWYVSTTNGRFFYSYDGGSTWDQSIQFVPGGHYLYGAAIYPSKLDENTVYFGGSGYSNPAVYKSTDGGQSFVAMNNGMPNTLVFEIAANEDESLFFAATEAGPYVYVVEEELWYDMSGMGAPNQTYWSVEYLEELQIVRFGTYGRGIWDFQIQEQVSISEATINNSNLKVFPNPSSDIVYISIENTVTENISLEIRNINGSLIFREQYELDSGQSFNETVSLSTFPKGVYIITLSDGIYLTSKQLIIQ